jgi:hypothetical protein
MVRLANFVVPFSWCVIDRRLACRLGLSAARSAEINGMF